MFIKERVRDWMAHVFLLLKAPARHSRSLGLNMNGLQNVWIKFVSNIFEVSSVINTFNTNDLTWCYISLNSYMPFFLLQTVLKSNKKNLLKVPPTIKKVSIVPVLASNSNHTIFSIILHFRLTCFNKHAC